MSIASIGFGLGLGWLGLGLGLGRLGLGLGHSSENGLPYIRLRYFIPVVISRSGFEGVLPFPETIFPQITYSRSRQNPIPKLSNFPANTNNEKV